MILICLELNLKLQYKWHEIPGFFCIVMEVLINIRGCVVVEQLAYACDKFLTFRCNDYFIFA